MNRTTRDGEAGRSTFYMRDQQGNTYSCRYVLRGAASAKGPVINYREGMGGGYKMGKPFFFFF